MTLLQVYDRIYLDDMATAAAYEKWGHDHGLQRVKYLNMTENLETHYASVRALLSFTSDFAHIRRENITIHFLKDPMLYKSDNCFFFPARLGSTTFVILECI